jgi:F0F1-type ATP synthase assembly protein I
VDKTKLLGCPYLFFKKMGTSKQEEKLLKTPSSVKDLALGMAAYTGASTFGPIVVLGLVGFFMDKAFETKPLFLIMGIAIAFIVTNALIFKKINKLIKNFSDLDQEALKENKEK